MHDAESPKRLIPRTYYLEISQIERLEALCRRLNAPAAEFVREGVEWVLKKYAPPSKETRT